MKQKYKDYPHVRLFKSDFMERLSFVYPIVPILIYGPLFLLLIIFDPATIHLRVVTAIIGFFLWTLLEYCLHRFVFHFISKSNVIRRITFLLHGIHHKDPHDPLRLVAPPLMSIGIGFILIAPLTIIFPSTIWFGLAAGLMLGYLMYDYTHYYFHHFTPKNRYMKYLRKNHFLHHFKTPRKKYGVSSPLWDIIFRTY